MAREQGLLAIFDDLEQLKSAAARVHERGVSKFDAFSPFPVHGLEKKMGLAKSFISKVTLVMGLSGAGLLFLFQWWTSAVDWPATVGGKPLFSWPAFIPITFEGMVLIGGISTVLALLFACRLPNLTAPVLDTRFTVDRFGLFVDRTDPKFDEAALRAMFRECDANEIHAVE